MAAFEMSPQLLEAMELLKRSRDELEQMVLTEPDAVARSVSAGAGEGANEQPAAPGTAPKTGRDP